MNKFIFHIFILQCCSLLPISITFAGNFTGYLIIKGSGITKDSKISLNTVPGDADYFDYEEPSNKEIPISVIPKLPGKVARNRLKSEYNWAEKIGDISSIYGNDVIFGKFKANKKETIKNKHLVFRQLSVNSYKNIMSFWADDDAYIFSQYWTGLTRAPMNSDLRVCLLFPKSLIEKVDYTPDLPIQTKNSVFQLRPFIAEYWNKFKRYSCLKTLTD